ncbi:MAG TPA: hypothetical protein C5S51_10450 [Methanosarcinaceae archaeon]|nr:hypothetical protein [Methanosarcinaceae archaeon]
MTDNETDPSDLQQSNRQTAINNLRDTHAVIERLMNKTYQQQDVTASSALRQIRTKVTALLSDMENIDLDTFSGREGTLEEFYDNEGRFIESSTGLLKTAEDALESGESVDTYSIESSVDTLEKSFNNRIILTKKHLQEYEKKRTESQSRKEPGSSAPDAEPKTESSAWLNDTTKNYASVIPKMYNYINILEQKYTHCQPEVSNNGDYLGNKTWKVDLLDYGIRGTVKDGAFKIPLVFETYWYPLNSVLEAAQFVQSQANEVGKSQYKSLCLINDVWDDKIKEWVKDFVHQRMSLFLYELENDTLTYKDKSEITERFEFWHSNTIFKAPIEEEIKILIEKMEYFTVNDVMGMFGFNTKGAEAYLYDLMKKGEIIDVGLDSPKYTKVKHREQ